MQHRGVLGVSELGSGDQKPLPLPPDNDGIHLAVSPQCGELFGSTADINAGIDGKTIETIVSFGVCQQVSYHGP